jgi:hypothetical protein
VTYPLDDAAIAYDARVGSCFDSAAAEALCSPLEWEVLSRRVFRDTIHTRLW